ncbi:hypothetical protein DL89DRAFT_281457 [Linderina pennispora]|uniref:Uncharacterized protein n=1 Tax=Linderina pennispora TaxID=61395 RepID=A0A1Y1WH75_9FUNG|nr:uncharacterized protein DL89DRAFT_281457 [Linderina pennispora]ORX72735.1 hypothetical protein DL89DRAFT_281457 [Linderina pennispora]
MSGFTPEYIGQIIDMVRSDDVYISNYLAVCLNYKVVSTVSYLLGIGFYQADFGYGVSKFTTVHPEFNMRTFMIMPSPPPSTDILVNVCVSPSVMNTILKNKFWMNLAEVVY